MATIRTFIAVELDREIRTGLGHLQARLGKQVPLRTVRWVQPDGIHLTLKFLGDTPLDSVDQVKMALAQAAAEAGPFAFSVEALGCFPNARQPRVIWVGLKEPAGVLTRLRDAVESHVAPLGFPTEKRPFSPHLTLGRVQRYASRSEVAEIGELVVATSVGIIGQMTATAVSYIRSDLRPTGAVYTTLLEASLGKR
jgi:2'-5' RNA ligase